MSLSSLIANIHKTSPKHNAFPKREFNSFLPITFESREQENRWFHMFKSMDWMKPMVTSLAPHRETLVSMGIKPQVYSLFERTHLDIDQVMGHSAYQSLVYEFLSSFTIIHGDTQYGEDSMWKFRIQNTTFQWSRSQAIFCLDFPEFGAYARPTEEQLTEFWEKLTDLKEFGPTSSPFSIDTAVWQSVHRLIATNINCQPETVDYVTMEDLELMWAIDEGESIDWFKVFTISFLSMQHQYGPHRFVGCTSLITLIAKSCGFQFQCTTSDHRMLDWSLWKKLGIIARPYELGPILTDVTEPNSWDDEPVDNSEEDPEEVQSEEPEGKKQKVELDKGRELNDKVDWDKVRRVIIYEF